MMYILATQLEEESCPDVILEKKDKIDILKNFLWYEIHNQIGSDVLKKHDVSIRKGWKIVISNKQSNSFHQFLSQIMPIGVEVMKVEIVQETDSSVEEVNSN